MANLFMTAQKTAIKRNALAEILIDFCLQKFSEKLYEDKIACTMPVVERQKTFTRNDCSEVYDHYISFSCRIKDQVLPFEIWGQTTCYKGNDTGAPESNKTYEIRETITEALSLRKWLIKENKNFRTIHITLGPSNYTYGWFKTAKASAFDCSLYPAIEGLDIFEKLSIIGADKEFEFEIYEDLENAFQNQTLLGLFVKQLVSELIDWFNSECSCSLLANKQVELLMQHEQVSDATKYVDSSKNSGADIKGKVAEFLEGGDDIDPFLVNTLKRVNVSNPFLPVAAEAIANWDKWVEDNIACSTVTQLAPYLSYLWGKQDKSRLIIRRLLMRLYTTASINYVQDVNIPGITEHNLYNGLHKSEQIEQMVAYLLPRYEENGVKTSIQLFNLFKSDRARYLINAARKFEKINGTSIKPSFIYIEEALLKDFLLVPFSKTDLPAPIAYYFSFANDTVKPYDNLKVVISKKTNKPIAIIKAKFFRKPEFPRRVKEEAYLGLTLMYNYDLENDRFYKKYGNLPLLMFVDMQKNYTPPEFSIRRLLNYGWLPFFNISDLHLFLTGLEQ